MFKCPHCNEIMIEYNDELYCDLCEKRFIYGTDYIADVEDEDDDDEIFEA